MDGYLESFMELMRDIRAIEQRIHRLETGQGAEGAGLPAPAGEGSLLYATDDYNASYVEWDGDLAHPGAAGQWIRSTATILEWTENLVDQDVTNVSNPPTDAELDAIFGTPAALGRGFVATVDDADGDTDVWLVWTTDASWFYVKGTKAV